MERTTRLTILLCVVIILSVGRGVYAQNDPVKIGIGFDGVLQTEEGLGIGVRTRISKPINWDVSAAVDFGFTGFILAGRDEASYVFDPQISLIVTFPDLSRATYMLGGFGLYAPFGDNRSSGGPFLHVGVGRASPLRDSTFYYEVNPALIILENSISVSIPFRVGIIL